ncbi:glycosyltransferase [Mucilaginibacter daejeonensis]|uniref:XrtY-associated glycosyltransferase XYAG1 n=1 Tax=Mucilaginibacter daejeonensis TaxID=398049 RepID=UPI001D17C822|nr:glycosyltransferase [Mucilaginibacter daejeonensis]UEG52651.1 glycosyltransferase [Mucilaginibacter daejeonensis]
MKILHIAPAYKPAYIYGGPTESVARLCEALAATGHTVDVYTTSANGKTELDVPYNKFMDVDGVNVIYFKRLTGDPTNVTPGLWKALLKNAKSYDVIHIHAWWNILNPVAAQICFTKGRKVILAPRGMLSTYIFKSGASMAKRLTYKMFGKAILTKCYLHATSDAELKECRKLIPGWKGFMLPNVIALPELPVKHQVNDVFTLIFLSRIHPKKGLDILFTAISKLSFDVKLQIAGSGENGYIDEMKALAAQLKVTDKIEWLGWMDREEKFLRLMQADLFVLTSLNENFANVVIESLHVGTAVLVSQDVGLADFVKNKEMGWVSTLEVNDVADKLTQAYADKVKLSNIRQNGRSVIQQNFSEKVLSEEYISEYKKIITQ